MNLAAGALLGGNALYQGVASGGFGEGDFGLGFGVVDQGGYLGVEENLESGEADETILAAAALEDFVGVREGGAPVEAEADALGVGGERDDGGGGAFGGGETENQEVVIIVDDFDGGGKAFAENDATGLDFFGQYRIEFREEAGDLFVGGMGGRRSIDIFGPDARWLGRFSGEFGFTGGRRHRRVWPFADWSWRTALYTEGQVEAEEKNGAQE
jgi:hypothetical protein